jgi:hypothetical protein
MISKIFSPKNFAKISALFAQTTASFYKNLIITFVFEKNAIFFADNWQKSQKIVIITSTPDIKQKPDNQARKISVAHLKKFRFEKHSSLIPESAD